MNLVKAINSVKTHGSHQFGHIEPYKNGIVKKCDHCGARIFARKNDYDESVADDMGTNADLHCTMMRK